MDAPPTIEPLSSECWDSDGGPRTLWRQWLLTLRTALEWSWASDYFNFSPGSERHWVDSPLSRYSRNPWVIWSFLLHSSVPCPKGKNLWEWSSPWKVWLGGDRYWMTAVVTNRLPFFKVIFRTSLQWNHSNHHGGSHLILSQHPQPPALQHAGLTGQMNGFVNGSPYSFTYRSDKITSHSHGQTSPDIAKFCNSSLVPQRKIEKQTNKKHNNLPGPEPSAAFQRKSRLCHIFFFPPKIKMCLQYNLLSKIEAFYLSLLQNRDYMETFNLESI